MAYVSIDSGAVVATMSTATCVPLRDSNAASLRSISSRRDGSIVPVASTTWDVGAGTGARLGATAAPTISDSVARTMSRTVRQGAGIIERLRWGASRAHRSRSTAHA